MNDSHVKYTFMPFHLLIVLFAGGAIMGFYLFFTSMSPILLILPFSFISLVAVTFFADFVIRISMRPIFRNKSLAAIYTVESILLTIVVLSSWLDKAPFLLRFIIVLVNIGLVWLSLRKNKPAGTDP